MQLKLTQLLQLIEEMPAYRQLMVDWQGQPNTGVTVLDAAKPYLIACLYHRQRVPLLVVTAQPEKSKKLYEQILAWSTPAQIKLFPEPDTLPYQRTVLDTANELERIQVLSALTDKDPNKLTAKPPLIIASAPALMQKITPYRDFIATSHTIETGTDIEPLELLRQWEAMGYQVESLVEVPGTISHRGGIIDIYPPASHLPARLEFLGNTIDEL